ncbi:MAG TPA: WYL domain-containing protein [Actinocatenispora sp.]
MIARPGPAVPAAIRAALAGRRVLRLAYTDRAGLTSGRDVEPIGFLGGEHWYLIGWCRLRDGVRGFRLDRITTAEALPETVPPRPVDLSEVDALGHELVDLDVIANTDRTVSRHA